MPDDLDRLIEAVEAHEAWRPRCVNLIASENVTSPLVRTLLASDMGHRYSLPSPSRYGPWRGRNFYYGTRYVEEVCEIGVKVARRLFSCEYADLRPVSGHVADLAVIMSLSRVGDTLYALSPESGGYPGLWRGAAPEWMGRRVEEVPYSREKANIDVDGLMRVVRGGLVFIGSSFIPFRHPVGKVAEVARERGARFAYDASHVLGLMAGGEYPNPLEHGGDVVVGSTHKSLPGPQGGIILARGEAAEAIEARVVMGVVDNPHYNRIAALTAALLEMEAFGREYARQVVANARALARALDEHGVPVRYREMGYTETHQVILGEDVDVGRLAPALERANIIVDCAGRLGTCEVTRLGFREGDMERIAEAVYRVYSGEEPERVRRDVEELMAKARLTYAFTGRRAARVLERLMPEGR